MLRQSKDEEILDRTAEVASAITEEGLRAGGESVPDRLSRERRSQLHDRAPTSRRTVASRASTDSRHKVERSGPPQRNCLLCEDQSSP